MMRLQVLVPIHTNSDGNSEKLATHVAAVARHLEADIQTLVLVADYPQFASPFGNALLNVPGMAGDEKTKSRARGDAIVSAIKRESEAAGIQCTSAEESCFPDLFGERVASQARYHDLTLVGIGGSDSGAQSTAESAVFASGRPVLMVPEQAPAAAYRHVAIAWDGSRVAARAVADARDFISRAEAVTVISVVDEKPLPVDDPAANLAGYLARRGTKAEASRVKGGSKPIAQALQEHAGQVGADLLVMGAFGHSRVRDFVLGGATTGILKDLRMATLLSH